MQINRRQKVTEERPAGSIEGQSNDDEQITKRAYKSFLPVRDPTAGVSISAVHERMNLFPFVLRDAVNTSRVIDGAAF